MDISEDGSMVHRWQFQDHEKILIFSMDKCVGCDLCRKICPTSCIELGPVPEIASGELQGVPPILINFEKCAYCGLCASICPMDALEFKTKPDDFIQMPQLPRFFYKDFIKFVKKDFKRDFYEPASSRIRLPENVVKPSTGEVMLRQDTLFKCDPLGCKGCLNICPIDCFWVPRKAQDIQKFGKITMDDELCMHCGACKNACPQKIIEVHRTEIRHDLSHVKDAFWKKGWENNINKLLKPEETIPIHKSPIQIAEEMQEESLGAGQKGTSDAIETVISKISPEKQKELEQKLEIIKKSLSKVNVRYWIEFKKLEKLRNEMDKSFKS
ncbi:MAG: 4Fe-4S binding protein [Promethearchaeota archaeon]